jgi:(hydroxyamino)benzene mutase
MPTATFDKPLVVAGSILFLLGLVQGAGVQAFANPRMALSAHLTAMQCGMAVMLAAVLWSVLNFGPKVRKLARIAIISGMYGLWIGLVLSAATGASQSLPIAGAGYSASRLVEVIVSALILGSSVLIILGWAFFVIGLARAKQS